jgi:hypothetical protein
VVDIDQRFLHDVLELSTHGDDLVAVALIRKRPPGELPLVRDGGAGTARLGESEIDRSTVG